MQKKIAYDSIKPISSFPTENQNKIYTMNSIRPRKIVITDQFSESFLNKYIPLNKIRCKKTKNSP